MKKEKLVLISSIGVIILLGILIGTGFFNLNVYKSNLSSNISSKWNNTKSIVKLDDSSGEISFPSLPVLVVYKSMRVGDIQAKTPLIIDISDKDFGKLWIPLLKKSDYNFTVACSYTDEIRTKSVIGKFILNGEITISGYYSITGFCSSQIARKLIIDKAMNDIYAEIKKNMK
jgi:hypothetical protein